MYRYVYSMFFCKKVGECPTYSGHLAMLVWENVISTIIRYPLPKHFRNFQRKIAHKNSEKMYSRSPNIYANKLIWYDMILCCNDKKNTHLADYMYVLYIQVWIISGQSWNTNLHRNSSWCPWFFLCLPFIPPGSLQSTFAPSKSERRWWTKIDWPRPSPVAATGVFSQVREVKGRLNMFWKTYKSKIIQYSYLGMQPKRWMA